MLPALSWTFMKEGPVALASSTRKTGFSGTYQYSSPEDLRVSLYKILRLIPRIYNTA